MGLFLHEAAAVDPGGRQVYMTEDEPDGGFYRFTPTSYPNLDAGLLEVAVAGGDGQVSWRALPNPTPTPADTPTRAQVPEMTRFDGGEGIWNAGGFLVFTTKGDGQVWSYDLASSRIEVLYDRRATPSSLDAVDNITVSAAGEIFVCEDGGDMEVGLITPDRAVSPFLRFTGYAHSRSEVCGAVFDPSGTRLYLTSQGAYPPAGGSRRPGAVYEINGPFRRPSPGSAPPIVYGPPAGERPGGGPLGTFKPRLRVTAPRRLRRVALWRRGINVTLSSRTRLEASVSVDSADLLSRPGRGASSRRPKPVLLARRRVELPVEREITVRLRPTGRGRRLLARRRRPLDARIVVSGRDLAGHQVAVVRLVRVSR